MYEVLQTIGDKKDRVTNFSQDKKLLDMTVTGMQDRRRKLLAEMEQLKESANLQTQLRVDIEKELKEESAQLAAERAFRLMDLTMHNKEIKEEVEKRKQYEHLPETLLVFLLKCLMNLHY